MVTRRAVASGDVEQVVNYAAGVEDAHQLVARGLEVVHLHQ